MDTTTLKFTALQNQIFRLMCINSGQKLNQREIALHLNATPTGIAKALLALKQNELIIINKNHKMNLNLISLNRNQRTLKLKQLENLKQIYELELTEYLEENYPGTTIILFGSYAKGEDTTTSDIDIAIIGTKNKKINLGIFEKRLERQINVNTYKSIKEINKELKENLFNGLILSGGIEL
ncbi:MAG: nucleotidyltransferase domain-containing protein [Candidatus Woesearchaeota archaeon]|jgi:predicted nucleotidyltransferase